MQMNDIPDSGFEGPERRSGQFHEIEMFMHAAIGLHFETRYKSEVLWWPTSHYDVAYTLAGYHPNLLDLLDRLCDGELIDSGLATFRLRVSESTQFRLHA